MSLENKHNRLNIIICGIGGDGIVKISSVLAKILSNDNYVLQNHFFGLSQKKGTVSSHIRVCGESDSSIIFKGECDTLVGTDMYEVARNIDYLHKDSTIITYGDKKIPSSVKAGYSKDINLQETLDNYNLRVIESENIVGKKSNFFILGIALCELLPMFNLDIDSILENIEISEIEKESLIGGLNYEF